MTRENKLALVVGFGLLLFVGILVSDHFSAAQRQETTRLASTDRSRDRASRPITIAAVTPPAASATSVQAEVAAAPANDVQPARGVTPIPSVAVDSRPALVVEPVVASRSTAVKTQESEPGVRLHPIAEGETLFSICKKEYNDGSLSTALAKFNKNVIPDPKKLRKGVTLRLPSADVLRGGPAKPARTEATAAATQAGVPALAAADVIAAESKTPAGGVISVVSADAAPAGKSAAKGGAKSGNAPDASKGGSYTVRKGDTLYAIAQRELGNRSRWKEIAALNGGSESLAPGTTLKLPARR